MDTLILSTCRTDSHGITSARKGSGMNNAPDEMRQELKICVMVCCRFGTINNLSALIHTFFLILLLLVHYVVSAE